MTSLLKVTPIQKRMIHSSSKVRMSSNKSPNDVSIASSAKDISIMFNIEKDKGIEIAKLLSSSAKEELSKARKLLEQRSSLSFSKVDEPSRYDLKIHALTSGIPFIGFGIMDNAILIWAGDIIDTKLGVLFSISTLCAAAIGNIISDIAGVGLGAYIEDFCATKLRLPKVNLTNAQRNLRSVRFAGQIGNMIGLTIGCIIGMFPLLLIDTEEVQQLKKEARMDQIFYDVVTEVKGLVGAESTCLYLIVDGSTEENSPKPFSPINDDIEGFYLCSKYETGNLGKKSQGFCSKEPISRGIVGRTAVTGKVVSISDVARDPDYDPSFKSFHKTRSDEVKNMLCVPVFDVDGKVIAVIQAINKIERGSVKRDESLERRVTLSRGFSQTDVKVIQALASHISVSLQNMRREEGTSLKEIVKILKEHGTKYNEVKKTSV